MNLYMIKLKALDSKTVETQLVFLQGTLFCNIDIGQLIMSLIFKTQHLNQGRVQVPYFLMVIANSISGRSLCRAIVYIMHSVVH